MSRARVISFINYKGGVAKTTSTYHVGCWLADHKQKRVLLIDIDPQTNLTFLCASIEDWQRRKEKIGTIASMYKRFLGGKPIDTKRYIWSTPIRIANRNYLKGVDLLPCDVDLIGEDIGGGQVIGTYSNMEMLKKNAEQFLYERSFIRKIVAEVEDKYDYILIDCPPNLYLMTQNALCASSHYVVTAIPDHLSTIGLNVLIQKANKIGDLVKLASGLVEEKKKINNVAELGSVLFVRARIGGDMLTSAHSEKMEEIRRNLGESLCFKTHTTELIGYTEAAIHSLPVWHYSSSNARRAAKKYEYPLITDEFLEKF